MRARNIKPSLFTNELLGEADPLFTLLFEGLWCAADREGRLEDRPSRLRALIFPFRPHFDVDAGLEWLMEHGFIDRYEAAQQRIIQVVEFLKHQHPHSKEAPSKLPTKVVRRTRPGNGKHRPSTDQGNVEHALIPSSLIADTGLLNPESGAQPEIPADLDLAQWDRWLEYRAKIRKPLKPASIPAAQRQLAAFGSDQAAVVEQSIASGYQGLFDRKANGGRAPRKTRFEELTEHLRG